MTAIKVLWNFAKLLPRLSEIERAWQRIQQEEHNADFKNQVFAGKAEPELAYKKGYVDGIKWVLDTFSR